MDVGLRGQPIPWRVFTARCGPAVSALKCATSLEVCMSLKGKHALITGSSRGIGRGIALKLAEKGAKIAVHYYQNERAANDTLGQVRKQGSDGLVIQADVTRPEQITALFRKVQAQFGSL